MDLSISVYSVELQHDHTFSGMRAMSAVTEWQSLSETNTKEYYSLPRAPSIEDLRRSASARCDEAEESFRALHEDPAYF